MVDMQQETSTKAVGRSAILGVKKQSPAEVDQNKPTESVPGDEAIDQKQLSEDFSAFQIEVQGFSKRFYEYDFSSQEALLSEEMHHKV